MDRAVGQMLGTFSIKGLRSHLAAVVIGALIGAITLVMPILAPVAVGAVAFALIALRYPVTLSIMIVASVTLFAGIPRGMIVPGLRINELLLVVAAGFTLVIVLTVKDRGKNIRSVGPVAAIFSLLVIGTVLVPVIIHTALGHAASTEALFDVFSPLKFFILFLVLVIIPTSETDRHLIILSMLVFSALVALVGLLQAAHIGPVIELIKVWYASEHTAAALAEDAGRVTSLMGAWNTLGILLMMSISIGWAALQVPALARYRVLIVGSMLLSTLCLLASGSFAGIGGLLACILIIERLTNPLAHTVRKLSIALLATVGGLLIGLPVLWPVIENRLLYQFGEGELLPQTFTYRFWIWTDVFWVEIVKHPLFGASLEIYQHYRWLYAESHYISLLFRFGYIGLMAHLLWVVLMLIWLYRRVRSGDALTRSMAATALATLAYLSFAALTNEVFLFTGSIDFLWILFALVAQSKKGIQQ